MISKGQANQLLERVAESIDDALAAEMANALQSVVMGPPPGRPGQVDMPILLGRLFAEGVTGRLCLQRDAEEKSVYVEAGLPVMAESRVASDRMLALLAREGVIDASQHREARNMVDATGRKAGAVLIELGCLASADLLPVIRHHYESIITGLFSWDAGCWRIEAGATAGPERARLLRHPAALIREGVAAGYARARMVSRLGGESIRVSSGGLGPTELARGGSQGPSQGPFPLLSKVFWLDDSAGNADVIAQVLCDRRESHVPVLFDGVRSVGEVVRAAGLPEDVVLQIGFSLYCVGVLRDAKTGGSGRPRGGLRDQGMRKRRIMAEHALALESDYFGVLGLPRSASTDEVRRAHVALRRELAPEAVGATLGRELCAEIGTIAEVLDEALRVLSSPLLRPAYQQSLADDRDSHPDRASGAMSAKE